MARKLLVAPQRAGDATVGGTLHTLGLASFSSPIIFRNTLNSGNDWIAEISGGALAFSYNYTNGIGGVPIKFLPRPLWPWTLDIAIPGAATIGGTLYVGTQVDADSKPITAMNSLKLAVDGRIGARSGIYVRDIGVAWPDYVFAPTYELAPLAKVEQYIQANHHLPDVPSVAQVKAEGVELVAMQALLLQKVEELTLHLIRLEKANAALQAQVQQLSN